MSQVSELTQNVASTVNIRTLSRPVWYMASPYSHPDPLVREARYKAVCMVAAQYLRQGITVFSPIAHTHPLEVIGFDEAGVERPETDFWRDLDLPFMEMCCGCVTLQLPGWKRSIGVAGEEKWFAGRHLPVVRDDQSWAMLSDSVVALLFEGVKAAPGLRPGEVIHLPDGTGEEKAIEEFLEDTIQGIQFSPEGTDPSKMAFSPSKGGFVPVLEEKKADPAGDGWVVPTVTELDDEIPF